MEMKNWLFTVNKYAPVLIKKYFYINILHNIGNRLQYIQKKKKKKKKKKEE